MSNVLVMASKLGVYRRYVLAGLLVFTLPWANAFASGPHAAAVDALFAEMQKPDVPGAAVGIYQGGKLQYAKGYGSADLDHNVPVTAQTAFNLASVSKQFTAFAAALLAAEGKLDLQADIRTYLPDFPDLGQKITVADLVHHVSGVRDYIALGILSGHENEGLIRQADAIAILRNQRALNFAPGTQYVYSNSGYALLAEVVQVAAGQSLREFLQERVFAPLGMKQTRVRDELRRIEPGYAVGYTAGRNGRAWDRAVYNREAVGPGNVISTVGDLALWMGNFARPRVGDKALIERLSQPVTLRDGTPVNYGFGLLRKVFAGHRAITHSGAISGFNTNVAYFPDRDFAVIVLANRPLDTEKVTNRLVEIYLGSGSDQEDTAPDATRPPPEQKREPVRGGWTESQLRALAGKYRSDEIDTAYTLAVDAGKLAMRSLWLREPTILVPAGPGKLQSESGRLSHLTLTLQRSTQGAPVELTLDSGDGVRGLRLLRLPPGF